MFHLLKGLIREKGCHSALATALGVSPRALDNRLNGTTDWRLCDVQTTVEFLEIPPDRVDDFFKVSKGNKKCAN